jgi:hypothetical protein
MFCRAATRSASMSALGPFSLRWELSSPLLSSLSSHLISAHHMALQSAIKNGIKSTKRMRHLKIRYFLMKQYVEENQSKVQHFASVGLFITNE